MIHSSNDIESIYAQRADILGGYLSQLLRVIFCDDGKYESEHGAKKAVLDSVAHIVNMRIDLANLTRNNDALFEEILRLQDAPTQPTPLQKIPLPRVREGRKATVQPGAPSCHPAKRKLQRVHEVGKV